MSARGGRRRLRVAMIAGTLGQGGAEKQLVAMAGALCARGVDVRVLSLGRGEFHEPGLRAGGIPVDWVGAHAAPPLRLAAMARRLVPWRPDVVHATHCYANLYAAVLGRLLGAVAVGSVRSDGAYDVAGMGGWAPWLLDAPHVMVANSRAGAAALRARGRAAGAVHMVPNVVDLAAFDAAASVPPHDVARAPHEVVAVAVGTLVPVKALERFVDALALAGRRVATLRGWIVGDGPEAPRLAARVHAAGLEDHVRLLGRRPDVPALLARADVLVLTSRHEGVPNAVLEAMSARLPVIATDVGDVRRLVDHGRTGFVVPDADDATVAAQVAGRLVEVATDAPRARRLGDAGRAVVEREHAGDRLAERLLAAYATTSRGRVAVGGAA